MRRDPGPALAPLAASLAIAAACPGAALGQQRLDPIAVEAERAPVTGETVEAERTVARSVVPRRRLVEGDANLAATLAREPGVQARETGGLGGFSSLTVRGATGAQTGVYLDGIRLNDGGDATVDLGALEALNLGAVELWRGGAPLALGAGDIGGAVNLRSLAPGTGDASRTALGLDGGSFGARGARASWRGRRGRWDGVGAAGVRAADNDFAYDFDNATPQNPFDDARVRRANADATRASLLGRAGYAWSEDTRTDVLVQATSRDRGVPTPGNRDEGGARYDTDAVQLHLAHASDALGAWNLRNTVYAHAREQRFDDPDSRVGLGAQRVRTDVDATGWKGHAERPGDAGTLSLAVEARAERLDSTDRLAPTRDVEASRTELSLAAGYALYLADERLVVVPGLSARRTVDDVRRTDEVTGLRGPDVGADERAFGPRIGARLTLSDAWRVRVSGARHFRAPSFAELFGDSGLLLPQPGLEPERGTNVDAALEWSNDAGAELELGVFASFRDELIVTAYDARGVGRAVNAGEARVTGAELSFRRALGGAFSVSGALTRQDARQRDERSAFDGRRLPGEAELAASLRLERDARPWRTWYRVDRLRGPVLRSREPARRARHDAPGRRRRVDAPARGARAARRAERRQPRRRARRGLPRLPPARPFLAPRCRARLLNVHRSSHPEKTLP